MTHTLSKLTSLNPPADPVFVLVTSVDPLPVDILRRNKIRSKFRWKKCLWTQSNSFLTPPCTLKMYIVNVCKLWARPEEHHQRGEQWHDPDSSVSNAAWTAAPTGATDGGVAGALGSVAQKEICRVWRTFHTTLATSHSAHTLVS